MQVPVTVHVLLLEVMISPGPEGWVFNLRIG